MENEITIWADDLNIIGDIYKSICLKYTCGDEMVEVKFNWAKFRHMYFLKCFKIPKL